MSGRNNDDYFDLDNFDDEIYSSKSRAEKASGKKPVPKAAEQKRGKGALKCSKTARLSLLSE